jgi:hypothetical protein
VTVTTCRVVPTVVHCGGASKPEALLDDVLLVVGGAPPVGDNCLASPLVLRRKTPPKTTIMTVKTRPNQESI